MGRLKYGGLGALFTLLFIGCAGAVFPYKYYALDADTYNGFLRGPDPKDDLHLAICTPTEQDRAPCLVVKSAVLLQMKMDYKDLFQRLKKCESK